MKKIFKLTGALLALAMVIGEAISAVLSPFSMPKVTSENKVLMPYDLEIPSTLR